MEKVSSDGEHIARMRGLSQSKSSLKRSTRSSPIPKTNSRSRVFPGPSDGGMRKRVKFSNSTSICEPKAIRNGPLPQNEVDCAKTSEFKSFKKLLEKSAHQHYYFDKVGRIECMEASSNGIPSKSDFRKPSLPVQNVSSIEKGFSLQKQEFKNKDKGAALSVPPSKITALDLLFHPSHSEGTMQEHKGTFSGNRARLLQLAAATYLQNVDDFLSNRSDFMLEILQRLGIGRNVSKHEKLQIPERKMSPHQFLASSPKKSNQIVKYCNNPQENSCTYMTEEQQDESLLALIRWDDNEIQDFPYNLPLKTSFERGHWKSDLLCTERAAKLLPDFDNPPSAIKAHNNTLLLLNSPFDTSELNPFPTYMGQLCKDLHFNSPLGHKELFDSSLNSEVDSFQADCILSNGYDCESYFQEEEVSPYTCPEERSKEQIIISLLEWDDGTEEQEMPDSEWLLPMELDQFTESLYDTFDNFHDDEIKKLFKFRV